MHTRLFKLISIFLLLAILAGCVEFRPKDNTTEKNTISVSNTIVDETSITAESETSAIDQLQFRHVEQEKEIGLVESMIDYNDNYAYGVNYPVFGNADIDTYIKLEADKFVTDFIAGVKNYIAASTMDRAVMTVDYKAYIETDSEKGTRNKATETTKIAVTTKATGTTKTAVTTKATDSTDTSTAKEPVTAKETAFPNKTEYSYLSIVFEIMVDVPGTGTHTEKIKTCVIDQNSGKLLALGDIFEGNYLSLISKKVIAHITADKTYSDAVKAERFKQNTAPKTENFTNFVVVNGKAVFYFENNRILTERFGTQSVAIPLLELYSVLKVKITERAAIRHIDGNDKLIALTFDDGPKTVDTNRVLDALEKVDGRATFFVLGLMVNKNSVALKRAFLMGCEIGNHSFGHKKMILSMSAKDILYQVDETSRLIKKVTGESPKIFRMPYGFKTDKAVKIINMPIIGWDVDLKDWAYKDVSGRRRSKTQRDKDKQKVINGILKAAQDGDIVLMHDVYAFSAEVAEVIIPELTKRGFKLVTVSEMFKARGITLENAKYYRYARK